MPCVAARHIIFVVNLSFLSIIKEFFVFPFLWRGGGGIQNSFSRKIPIYLFINLIIFFIYIYSGVCKSTHSLFPNCEIRRPSASALPGMIIDLVLLYAGVNTLVPIETMPGQYRMYIVLQCFSSSRIFIIFLIS